jgi:hypothetical protein
VRAYLVDVTLALAWTAVVLVVGLEVLGDDETVSLLVPGSASLLLGFASGRQRIALTPLVLVLALIAFALIDPVGCDPAEGCVDDVNPVFEIVFLALLAGGLAFLIMGGVLLRSWVSGRSAGPPDPTRPEPS